MFLNIAKRPLTKEMQSPENIHYSDTSTYRRCYSKNLATLFTINIYHHLAYYTAFILYLLYYTLSTQTCTFSWKFSVDNCLIMLASNSSLAELDTEINKICYCISLLAEQCFWVRWFFFSPKKDWPVAVDPYGSRIEATIQKQHHDSVLQFCQLPTEHIVSLYSTSPISLSFSTIHNSKSTFTQTYFCTIFPFLQHSDFPLLIKHYRINNCCYSIIKLMSFHYWSNVIPLWYKLKVLKWVYNF